MVHNAESIGWFMALLAVALVCGVIGRRLARLQESWVRAVAAFAVLGVALAAIPRFRPALLHEVLPLDITIWFEGVLAVFPWMILVGVLSKAHFTDRLQRTAPLLFVLGLIYYIFGAVWMVLPPIDLQDREVGVRPSGVFLQSAPDTCTAASAATALHFLGIKTTEQEMANVVRAKPGRGSTLGRVTIGLRDVLTPAWNVDIRDLDAVEIAQRARVDRPILVVIRSGVGADHMVVVLGQIPAGILVANPSPGMHGGVVPLDVELPPNYGNEVYAPEDFIALVRPGAIVFTPNMERHR
jgi:hypothetical protein